MSQRTSGGFPLQPEGHLASISGQRTCLERRQYAPAVINLRLAAVRCIAYEAADAGPPALGAR